MTPIAGGAALNLAFGFGILSLLTIFFYTRNGDNAVLERAMDIQYDAKVGIGVQHPLEKLHIDSGSVLVTGTGEGYAFETGAAANTLDDYEEGTLSLIHI